MIYESCRSRRVRIDVSVVLGSEASNLGGILTGEKARGAHRKPLAEVIL